jgi:hypothetical protein
MMPYLSNSRQLRNLGLQIWHGDRENLLMPRGLKLINDIVCNKYYRFQEISQYTNVPIS